jgi:hypothetical protein
MPESFPPSFTPPEGVPFVECQRWRIPSGDLLVLSEGRETFELIGIDRRDSAIIFSMNFPKEDLIGRDQADKLVELLSFLVDGASDRAFEERSKL